MKHKLKKISKSSFVRNTTVMASGTAGAQLIAILLSPLITRLYGPDAFGIMGTFQAMIGIIVPIAALTYPIAIVLPRSDQNAKGLVRLSLVITLIISLISFVIIGLFNQYIVAIFNLEEISSFLYLIPFVVIFAGLMQTAEQWVIRTKQFSLNANATFFQSIIVNGSKVGLGFFYPFASVLVVLTSLGNGIKAGIMIVFAKRSKYEGDNSNYEEKKSSRNLAKQYYDFPIYRAPQEFTNSITNGLPVLMLTAFFGPASAGFYTIGRTVLKLPSRLIGKAVGDVFYPRIVEAVNKKEDVNFLIKKATIGLAGVGIIPFSLVILFGPFLFTLVFGSEWTTAGEYARWIALWSFSSFINRPSVRTLPALNAQRFHLIYTIIMLVVRILALAIGYFVFKSDLVAIMLFGVSGALLNLGLIFITFKISRKRKQQLT